MKYLITLAVYVLVFGTLGATLALSFTLWGCRREQKFMKIFLFISYLTLLYLLSGMRFALTIFAGWDRGILTFDILERVFLASLIFFLPATMNFLLGRKWTVLRVTRIIISAIIYLSSGIVSLFTQSSPLPGMLAVLSFLLIIFFVMADAASVLPLIRDEVTRIALTLLYSITFLYLPLAQVIHLILTGYELLLFLALVFYYFILSICAIVYFHRLLISATSDDDRLAFREICASAGLTKREAEIAELISTGLSYKEIASLLDISPNTVSNHIGTIYRKTGTRSKVDMVNTLRDYSHNSAREATEPG